MKHYLTALLLVCLTTLVQAQTTPKTGTLADISFIAGHWQGTHNGGPIEATWSAPAGDNMIGFIRMIKDNKITLV